MIVLTDVAAKLQEILNSAECPTDFSFVVKSQGYHLDSIADEKKGTNLIPVFLTMVGGEYNPVPNLHEANFTYGIDIWFPIRFKETFYAINEYLEEVFVGKQLKIGGKVALCNIGVAEYGEITNIHLDQFEEWVNETYEGNVLLLKKQYDISEEYMNMHFNLFATTLGDGFIFGNGVKYKLSFKLGETTYTENLVWDSSGTGASVSPVSEQLVGVDKFVRNIGNITNFNKSISAYVRNNEFWSIFLQYYNEQRLNELEDVKLTKTYTFGETTKEYEFNQITLSYNENVALGEPVSFTLAFGDGE